MGMFDNLAKELIAARTPTTSKGKIIEDIGRGLTSQIRAVAAPIAQKKMSDYLTGQYAFTPYRFKIAKGIGEPKWNELIKDYEDTSNVIKQYRALPKKRSVEEYSKLLEEANARGDAVEAGKIKEEAQLVTNFEGAKKKLRGLKKEINRTIPAKSELEKLGAGRAAPGGTFAQRQQAQITKAMSDKAKFNLTQFHKLANNYVDRFYDKLPILNVDEKMFIRTLILKTGGAFTDEGAALNMPANYLHEIVGEATKISPAYYKKILKNNLIKEIRKNPASRNTIIRKFKRQTTDSVLDTITDKLSSNIVKMGLATIDTKHLINPKKSVEGMYKDTDILFNNIVTGKFGREDTERRKSIFNKLKKEIIADL